jgi:hypothetical protein
MIIADIVLPYVTSALSRYERIAYGILSQSIARIRRSERIERYYIERFLSEHAQRIRGSVLEGKDAGYTPSFRARDAPPTWSTSTGTTATPTCMRT